MTTLTGEATRPAASRRASHAAFTVVLGRNWNAVSAEWDAARGSDQASAFQNGRWLRALYDAFSGRRDVEPLLVTIRDSATGEIAMRLPLVKRTVKRLSIVEFADIDLTDYNAPLLGPAAPREAAAAQTLWRGLHRALRRQTNADLIRLKKVPIAFAGRPNPLAMLAAAGPCSLNGNVVVTGDTFETYRRSLKRDVRKVLDRCWRNFSALPAATFQIIADPAEALRFLGVLQQQQRARMRELDQNFVLDEGSNGAFYRNLVRDNAAAGYAVVSALKVADEVVAVLIGIREGSRYVMLRVSNAGEKWSHCSPGRLVIERTMAALHQDGVREFDFGIGNYDYKRRFGVAPFALADVGAALSWRGIPYALRDRAARELRRHPELSARVMRLVGKRPATEQD